jgi:hypothetical protein
MASMSETVIEALAAAREAHARATEALRLAEGAARAAGVEGTPAVVDRLTVKRIDVVEDDGTLRMVIGNSDHAHDVPMRGRLVRHPGRARMAGILFVDDEGTECGGLQFGGGRTADGVDHGGYLTFDDYEQNESFRLGQAQDAAGSRKWLEFSDLPDWSLVDMVDEIEGLDPEKADEVQERYLAGEDGLGRSRMRLAREDDGSVGLVLRDARGQDRLRLVVPADGDVVAEVLDADGIPRSLL